MNKDEQAADTKPQPTEAEEFDRLMALDDEAGNPDHSAPEPTAAQSVEGEGKDSGGQAVAGDGGDSGGTVTEQPATTGATSEGEDAWLAALPEDVQARIKADREAHATAVAEAQQRYDALHGRLAPTQQKLADAERRLAQLSRQQPAPAQAPTAPAAGATQQEVDSFFDSPRWKQYAEDYPGDAQVLRSMYEAQQTASQRAIQSMDDRINQLTSRLANTEQVATRTVVNEEISLLEKRHPDWKAINDSDEFWSWFDGWRADQPKSLRPMYYDDAQLNGFFNDAEWTASVLDQYKAQKPTQAATTTTAPAASTTQQTESTPPAQAPASNGRLAMSVAPQVRGGAPLPTAVDLNGKSEAEAFDILWKMEG